MTGEFIDLFYVPMFSRVLDSMQCRVVQVRVPLHRAVHRQQLRGGRGRPVPVGALPARRPLR